MSPQLVGISADQPRAQVAESSGAHLADGVWIAARPDEADHLLNRDPGGSRLRSQLGQLVDVIRLQIPPIRVLTNEFHHAASAATQNQRYRMAPPRELSHARLVGVVNPV